MDENQKILQVIDTFVKKNNVIGLSAVIVKNCTSQMFNRGVREKEELPIDEKSIFEIGSLTKLFTALLLAQMVQLGKVKYSDYISDLLPNASRLNKVTLEHLATHTSGLPRLPNNIHPRNIENPYQGYSLENFLVFLNQYTEDKIPGEEMLYSNLGYALLGYVLTQADKDTYESILKKYIFEPLSMSHSYIIVPLSEKIFLTAGYKENVKKSYWDGDFFTPAGGIKSTISDIEIFLKAYLNCSQNEIFNAMHETINIHWISSDKKQQIGLGWHVQNDIFWHNGRTGGFSSFIGFNPDKHIGIAILTNTAVSVDSLAKEIFLSI